MATIPAPDSLSRVMQLGGCRLQGEFGDAIDDLRQLTRLADHMAVASTKTRPNRTSSDSTVVVSDLVLAAVRANSELTLVQLRSVLKIGADGPTESQLARSLRKLVESEQLIRPRRGVYATVAPIVPAQRRSVSDESVSLTTKARPVRAAQTNASPASDKKIIARALSAAPSGSRRLKRTSGAKAACVVEPVESAAPAPAQSAVQPEPYVPEPVVDVPAAQDLEVAAAPTAVVIAPQSVPVDSGAATRTVQAATVSESVWMRKAMLPIAWFAITGLFLMFGGAILGGLVGVALGALAIWIYVRERSRQRQFSAIDATGVEDGNIEFESTEVDALSVS